jgi:hypothetical protein
MAEEVVDVLEGFLIDPLHWRPGIQPNLVLIIVMHAMLY